jgi:hypothetical protein
MLTEEKKHLTKWHLQTNKVVFLTPSNYGKVNHFFQNRTRSVHYGHVQQRHNWVSVPLYRYQQ